MAQHLVGELGQRDRVAPGQAMAGAQAHHERFAAEHLGGDPGRFGDWAAGEGNIDVGPDATPAGLTAGRMKCAWPRLLGLAE